MAERSKTSFRVKIKILDILINFQMCYNKSRLRLLKNFLLRLLKNFRKAFIKIRHIQKFKWNLWCSIKENKKTFFN
jgi:hypothetical protein